MERIESILVIPAQAGMHPFDLRMVEQWMPAFASMTTKENAA